MTLDQTRQLAIEFERRLYTINPSFQFENKIDTEEMYAYLNEYAHTLMDQAALAESQGQPDQYGLIVAQSIMPLGTNTVRVNEDAYVFGHQCVPFAIKDCYRFIGGSIVEVDSMEPVEFEDPEEHGGHILSHLITHFGESAPVKVYNTIDIQRVLQKHDNNGAIFRHNPAVIWPTNSGESGRNENSGGDYKIPEFTNLYVFDGAIRVTNPIERGVYFDNPDTGDETGPYPKVQLHCRYIPEIPYFEIGMHNKTKCNLPYSCFYPLVEGAVQLYIERAMSAQQKPRQERQVEQSKSDDQ